MAHSEIPCTVNYAEMWHPLGIILSNDNLLAKQMCGLCPLESACLTVALWDGADGIWGGTTVEERRAWKGAGREVMEINAARKAMASGLASKV